MSNERNMTLEECVSGFLELALTHPEKEPKTQREQRENQMLILGYNRAQENLRSILEHHGKAPKVRALAEVRREGQQQPINMGGTKLWIAS